MIRDLRLDELEFANSVYASIGFVLSTEADTLLVAERDGARVALGRLVPLEPGAVELGGIWTAPEARRGGLARQIVTALLARAGAATVYCIPFTHLAPFYASFGLAPAPRPWPAAVSAKVAALHAAGTAVEILRRLAPVAT